MARYWDDERTVVTREGRQSGHWMANRTRKLLLMVRRRRILRSLQDERLDGESYCPSCTPHCSRLIVDDSVSNS